CGQGTNVPRTF
nr:immunoglobulin light chain junction region [Macaca mulatta]